MNEELNEYISIDIETTGLDFQEDDVIQISASRFVDGVEVDYFTSYVNVPFIPSFITDLTGISLEHVVNAPKLDKIMPFFQDYIKGKVLVGHNVKNFDFPFLKAKGYDIFSDHEIYDTRYFANTRNHGAINGQLETLKIRFGIEAISHNALSDARVTALIFQELLKMEPKKKESKTRKITKVVELDDEDTTPFFEDMSFVVTGAFENSKYNRRQIEALIKQHGGKVTSSLSQKIDYFIQGIQVSTQLKDGKHSSKELKYLSLINSGVDIQKLDGDSFNELIEEYRNYGG